jgi:integrase
VSIDRLPSGKWRVRYYVEGHRRSKAFSLKRDAEKFDRDIHRAIETGEISAGDTDLQTLAELAAEYMRSARRELAIRTFRGYRDVWASHVDARVLGNEERQWHHAIAETSLRLLLPKVIEEWRDERLDAGAGASSIRKAMVVMQAMLERALRDEKVRLNAARIVKKPSGRRKGSILVVPPEKVEQIRANLAEPEGRTLVSVLAYSGLRPGEALALRWSDIGTKTIRVEGGSDPDGSAKETKTGVHRNVPLLKPLADDLNEWRSRQNGSPRVFSRGGSGWTEDRWRNWRKREFQAAAEGAGVEIKRAYDLRHSIASLWLHEGLNPVEVAARLGHNVAETFKTYAHVIAELDPKDKTTATTRIKKARRAMTHS